MQKEIHHLIWCCLLHSFCKLLQFYCGSRAKHSWRRREKVCVQQPHKTLAKAEKWNWQWKLPLPSVLLSRSIGNQLQQLNANELLMTLTLGNWALTSIYETKETEVGKCYSHFAYGTKPADSKQFHDITPCRGSLIASMLSQFCLYMSTHHLDLCSTLPTCDIFPHQRGTVNAPCTEFNSFSNHILLPFQRWGEKGCSK